MKGIVNSATGARNFMRAKLINSTKTVIYCTSYAHQEFGPAGWSCQSTKLLPSGHLRESGRLEGMTAPMIQLYACVEALRVLPTRQSVQLITDSQYAVGAFTTRQRGSGSILLASLLGLRVLILLILGVRGLYLNTSRLTTKSNGSSPIPCTPTFFPT